MLLLLYYYYYYYYFIIYYFIIIIFYFLRVKGGDEGDCFGLQSLIFVLIFFSF